MNLKLLAPLALGAMLVAGAASAQSGEALLQSKGCMMCHNMSGQKVGPGFKETAAKYAGQADAKQALFDRIKAAKPHPKVTISDDDLNASISTVLETK
jgi:cytochrome c